MPPKQTVAVVGDVIIDWMLAVPDFTGSKGLEMAWAWDRGQAASLSAAAGGAPVARDLLATAVKDARLPVRVVGPRIDRGALTRPGDTAFNRSHTAWFPFDRSRDRPDEKAWRIAMYLGEEQAHAGPAQAIAGDADAGAILVVDMRRGFADAPSGWPAGLRDGAPPREVVLIGCSPLARGPLWERLVERHADGLTLVALIEDLRKDSLAVGYSLSWEQVYRDVVDAVRGSVLGRAKRVAVLVGLLGVVIVERDGFTRLVFDPRAQERDLVDYAPGRVTGYLSCLGVALLREILASDHPDLEDAAKRGLSAARAIHLAGYDVSGAAPDIRLAARVRHRRRRHDGEGRQEARLPQPPARVHERVRPEPAGRRGQRLPPAAGVPPPLATHAQGSPDGQGRAPTDRRRGAARLPYCRPLHARGAVARGDRRHECAGGQAALRARQPAPTAAAGAARRRAAVPRTGPWLSGRGGGRHGRRPSQRAPQTLKQNMREEHGY